MLSTEKETAVLAQKKCMPCEGIGAAFTKAQAEGYLKKIFNWMISSDGKEISREFIMRNFLAAVDLIRQVAKIAEEESHHPDIHLTGYRKLKIVLSTHALDGLTENDFILAAKIDRVLPKKI